MLTRHLTFRLGDRLHAALAKRARERMHGEVTVLARQYIEEGVAMDQYPGIVFRDGTAGRRPALAGRRLDVAQVIQSFRASGGNRSAVAEYLDIADYEVEVALAYYADHKDEVDEWLRDAQEAADEAQASWERQRQLTQL